MKARLYLLLACVVSCLSALSAQSGVRALDRLIFDGNIAYELGGYSRIRECADSANALMQSEGLEGDMHRDYSVSVLKLYGNYHYLLADTDSAKYYYDRAYGIMTDHPETDFGGSTRFHLLRDRAQLYYLLEDYQSAVSALADADEFLTFDEIYPMGSDIWLVTRMSYALCLARTGDFDKALAVAETELENATDKLGLEYARAERMYGKIILLASGDSDRALQFYKSFFYRQRDYAMQNFAGMDAARRAEYWQMLRPFVADCYRLEGSDPGFLYDVTLFAKGLLLQLSGGSGSGAPSAKALAALSHNWKDIQGKLDRNAAAVEFVQYVKSGSQHMAAIVLRSSGKPSFVRLTPPEDILSVAGGDLESTGRDGKDRMYSDSVLHSLVWTRELMSAISGAEKVYFAPDGYMHRMAIEYMPPVESVEMYRLTSTRRLLVPAPSLSRSASALFFGGINYDLDRSPGLSSSNDAMAYRCFLGKYFTRLSDSSNEARGIFESRANPADSLLSASFASESAFRLLAPGYESILVSTHGYFQAPPALTSDLKSESHDLDMSRSVIAFAGANAYLRRDGFDAGANYDGLLSASEISGLDLTGCGLFTVSACQSALGSVTPDGVFGLQRGLKNAGVGAMLLSLWNVNSEATAMLMRAFYSNLDEGMGMRRAFMSARKQLMSRRTVASSSERFVFNRAVMASRRVAAEDSVYYGSPQYVNAFVLIDAID